MDKKHLEKILRVIFYNYEGDVTQGWKDLVDYISKHFVSRSEAIEKKKVQKVVKEIWDFISSSSSLQHDDCIKDEMHKFDKLLETKNE